MFSKKNILVLSSTISYHGYHIRKWLVVAPIWKGSFCKEILEHVIEILSFNVTRPIRPIIECASPIWDTNNKNVIQKAEIVQRNASRFILYDYNKDSSESKMIKKLNLDSTE